MNTEKQNDSYFAVIDTETTWRDSVMSIGVAIAESSTFKLTEKKYYIISPECEEGGMYSYVLMTDSAELTLKSSRQKVIEHLVKVLQKYQVDSIFAYNASFDYKHLPELKAYKWFDIMKIAAYKQYNSKIPENADCCGTGRLKRDYGVEPITILLSGNPHYCEVHNAVCDAVDELRIMELLGYAIEDYSHTQITSDKKTRVTRQKITKPIVSASEGSKSSVEKQLIDNCKFAVGDRVKHIDYGYGIIQKIEILKLEALHEKILLLTVFYAKKGICLNFLPADEDKITLVNN